MKWQLIFDPEKGVEDLLIKRGTRACYIRYEISYLRNGKCIPVHRNILVARSPVFAELLRQAEEEEELPGKKVGS